MKHITLLWTIVLFFTWGCTNEIVDDMPVRKFTDQGIFDQENPTLLGKVFKITPNPIAAGDVGKHVIVQDFINDGIQVGASAEGNPHVITLAVDGVELDATGIGGPTEQLLIQGVIRFGTGTSQAGQPGASQLPSIPSEIVFDVENGTTVSFPATAFVFFIRYTGVARTAAYALNDIIGPTYTINVSMGYGDKAKAIPATKTDPMFASIAHGASGGGVQRALYARAFQVTWKEYSGAGSAGPVDVNVANFQNTIVYTFRLAPNVAGTPFLPPPIIPWPAGAQSLTVTNQDGANPITFTTVQQFLDL